MAVSCRRPASRKDCLETAAPSQSPDSRSRSPPCRFRRKFQAAAFGQSPWAPAVEVRCPPVSSGRPYSFAWNSTQKVKGIALI